MAHRCLRTAELSAAGRSGQRPTAWPTVEKKSGILENNTRLTREPRARPRTSPLDDHVALVEARELDLRRRAHEALGRPFALVLEVEDHAARALVDADAEQPPEGLVVGAARDELDAIVAQDRAVEATRAACGTGAGPSSSSPVARRSRSRRRTRRRAVACTSYQADGSTSSATSRFWARGAGRAHRDRRACVGTRGSGIAPNAPR